MDRITVYDNGSKTFDRYTVIIGRMIYGMSENPTSAQGFNQYGGMIALPGERPGPGEITLRNVIRTAGNRVQFSELPEPVRIAIVNRQ
jgi:hypothetical protein